MPGDYTKGDSNTMGYKVVRNPKLNQADANRACREDGAFLAMAKTDNDAADMTAIIGIAQPDFLNPKPVYLRSNSDFVENREK